ncbi:MAG: hypothetical protein ACFFED_00345 [Candidatus Thorarchaeota archaeon]
MDTQGTKLAVIATIVVLAVAASAIVLINIPDDDGSINTSGVSSITILANSTDIVYPELMEATFGIEGSEWVVTANFVDDSEGWESPEIYDRTFSVTDDEVTSISDALSAGLNLTVQSEDNLTTILIAGDSIGFHMVITYNDGGWASIWTLQTEKGHILFKSGMGTPDLNMVDADLLEPVGAMNGLVTAIYTVFSNNLTV